MTPIIAVTILAAAAFRILGILSYISWDMRLFIIPWYDTLAEHGFGALAQPFYNYTPPYLYLLWLSTWTQSFLPKTIAIKLLSIMFDFGNAYMVYKILKLKYTNGKTAFLGAGLFLILPTIILNSSFWGQADSIYTFFVLVSLYYLLQERSLPAILALGAAFAFKAQAIFFAPLFFLLSLKRRIPWIYYLLIPLVYFAMMLPAILAGRPLLDVMTVYLTQADTSKQLSAKAPNFYLFIISNTWYHPTVIIGLSLTAILIIIWAVAYAHKIKTITPEILIFCAAVSAICLPFLLPKMHERYFYLADILVFLLAFYVPRMWLAPICSQIVSTLSYTVFLLTSPDSIPRFAAQLLVLATLVNTILIGSLLWGQYKFIREESLSA